MRTIVLTLSLLCYAQTYSQITVNWWNFLAPSEFVTLGSANMTNITHTAPGPNQTWNYATLQDNFTRSFSYGPAQWNAGHEFFPDASYAHVLADETMFLNVNESGYDIVGFYADPYFSGQLQPYILEPSKREIAFPMTFGQTWQNTSTEKSTDYELINADSLVNVITTHRKATVDAWGIITTPLGTFQALRLHTNDSIITNITLYSNGAVQSTQNDFTRLHQYAFYSNHTNAKYYLVKYRYEPQFNEIFKLEWQKSAPVLGGLANSEILQPQVFPNPATATCTVQNIKAGSQISLLSPNGQLIARYTCSENKVSIDLKSIDAGIYTLLIQDTENTVVKKLVVL